MLKSPIICQSYHAWRVLGGYDNECMVNVWYMYGKSHLTCSMKLRPVDNIIEDEEVICMSREMKASGKSEENIDSLESQRF